MNKKEFIDYLNDPATPFYLLDTRDGTKRASTCTIFLKYPATDDIILFYSIEKYFSSLDSLQKKEILAPAIGNSFKYGGFYSKTTNELYDLEYSIEKILSLDPDDTSLNKLENLKARFAHDIEDEVSRLIHSDSYSPEGIITEKEAEDLAYYANDIAVSKFFENKLPEDIFFSIGIEDRFDQDDLFGYIKDPKLSVAKKASLYMQKDTKNRYGDLWVNRIKHVLEEERLARESLQKIIDDRSHIYHKQRCISGAIKDLNAKTVKVTICKDNQQFTFTSETATLAYGRSSSYSVYNMKSQDRTSFHELFGRYAEYSADDIVEITYGKKVLYNRIEFDANNGGEDLTNTDK